MKANAFLAGIFISFTFASGSGYFHDEQTTRIGGTQLNGVGCICHSMAPDENVHVWIEGPDTLAAGQSAIYKMFMTGGPAEAGGYNVAGRFGRMQLIDTLSKWDERAPNELTQAFALEFSSPEDTIVWPFEYFASDSSATDTLYSTGLSLVYNGIPDPGDKWSFGPKFPLTIVSEDVMGIKDHLNSATSFKLEQNYPNPFNPVTTVQFRTQYSGHVSLKVYDLKGSVVTVLVDDVMPAGNHQIKFDGSGLTSGVYIYRIISGKYSESKKFILIK